MYFHCRWENCLFFGKTPSSCCIRYYMLILHIVLYIFIKKLFDDVRKYIVRHEIILELFQHLILPEDEILLSCFVFTKPYCIRFLSRALFPFLYFYFVPCCFIVFPTTLQVPWKNLQETFLMFFSLLIICKVHLIRVFLCK